ncbi:hypothetical protein A6A04_09825 [Paramagnetospirillum marisnigri]|uniref:Uncharacterized protein n=1 Tax=Paramagnetospirillum marisnigri TaxID=1285242 RepID=A0A178M410_9PROT|nr:hypothetical protein [Paramagnetospirillum marisnigri]OAN42990.1 hypothetical protein A6A04_09825 [Paramagnetospirillum marisnigri]
MSTSSVLIISVAAGIILVVGGGLMMYMAGLVKNAYELKVQINADIEEKLGKMAEDLDKKSRWIKRDLLEEIEKIKSALEVDNARKFEGLGEPLIKRIDELDQIVRKERDEWVKAIESDRENITKLDGKIGSLRRDLKQLEQNGGVAAAVDAAAAALAGGSVAPTEAAADPTLLAAATARPPAAVAAPVSASAPAKSAADPKSMPGFLPDLGTKKRT